MAEVKWTKEQQSAIYEKNSNILVAAAAGSGKTAVLVERIINKIVNENIDIDKLLVVTFTNAAASEMRERILDAIYKKIEENPADARLQKQITLLNKASISTIHSFCLEVIRNYFYELDISANFRIGDTAEVELLKQDVIEDLFEEKYFEQDKAFINLIDTYTTYRGDEPLKELILRIYNYIQSAPFPKEWLEKKVEMFNLKDKLDYDYAKTVWGEILIKEYKEKIQESRLKLEGIKTKMLRFPELEKFTGVIFADINNLKEIEDLINSNTDNLWNKTFEKAINLKFDRWPTDKKVTVTLKDDAKDVRDKVKKDIDKVTKSMFIYDSKQANQDIYSMYENLVNLKNIVNEFEEKFEQKKKEKNIIDFHDIEHFALKILVEKNEEGNYVPTKVAEKIKEKYQEIAIDEYQDSNLVQEYILKSISNGNNIFMVGDVKQSIYRFRQARPELFLEKYSKYDLVGTDKEYKEGKKIQLFKNFRSRKNILEVTNNIFEQIMSKELGDIDYTQEEYLNLGADYPEFVEDSGIIEKAELHIIDLAKEESEEDAKESNEETNKESNKENNKEAEKQENQSDTENIEENENLEPIENTLLEAKFVANKIEELINSDYKIYDRKKGCRKIEYKDIVILLRTTSNVAPIYEKELTEKNIPVFSDTSSEYLDSTEIQTIMSVLKIINNPLDDIALVTVLRSSIGNFTDNDLVEIRLADKTESFYNSMLKARVGVKEELKEKIDYFINLLEKWRKMQEYKTLDELIWQIYMDSNYYNYVGLLNNGKLKQANLKMLFEKAKQYESASFKGLYNFIGFIEKVKTSSKDMGAAKIIGENDNVVRIMSIHKSKGLEFPVVFLCRAEKQFNLQDLNDNVLMHQDMGFGLKYINYERRIEYDTLAKEALKLKIKNETISEEMRVLYVALTRAKEKLYITGVSKDLQKGLKEKEELIEIYNESKLNKNLIAKYKSYLDWIELVYLNNKNTMKELIKIYEYSPKEINLEKIENEEKDLIQELNNEAKNENKNINKIEEKLSWNYPYKASEIIPTKTSVSKIKEEKNKQKENEKKNEISNEQEENKEKSIEEKQDNSLKSFLVQELNDSNETITTYQKELSVPKFEKEEKITNAQKGTLMHLCIQHLDESKEYEIKEIEELIDKLCFKNIITEKQKEAINKNTIIKYTKSELFKELKQAKEIHKEEPFYINIPASEIYGKEVEENVLVQGIIDLYYINKEGNVILVDYKTDYAESENELKEKYKEQLNLYKKALENSLNVKVSKVIIYSLYMQKEIEL